MTDEPVNKQQLASMIDYAHRKSLQPYDDGRIWFLVVKPELPLEEIAWCCLYNPDRVLQLLDREAVQTYSSIKFVPGNDFHCIYFEDAYFLKAYPSN